jgi:SAM-dependent methyltransferase
MVVSHEVRVDTFVKDALMERRKGSLLGHLQHPFWDTFMEERVKKIFEAGGKILDIGGGLRIDKTRGDRENPANVQKFGAYLSDQKVDYKVSDYTGEYHPDYVEDIHHLSFESGSFDAIICIATLEHVYDPLTATSEILRVLKPGGMAFIYAPYIYRYHAHKKDYRDYCRFSKDAWGYFFRECTVLELCPVRGLFESLLRFTPLHTFAPFRLFARVLDTCSGTIRKVSEVQTSGYNVFLVK